MSQADSQESLLLHSLWAIMIFYLLFPALTLGLVESQPANVTEEDLSKVVNNQTFSVFTDDNSTMKPDNVTSSLYKHEMTELEDKLQGNQTSAFIPEDDERFQDQNAEFPFRHCQQDLLVIISHISCGKAFHEEMQAMNKDDWCVLEKIIRPYNSLTECLEGVAVIVGCYFPNPDIQDFFLFIHSNYFQNCTNEEEVLFEDAPHSVVITLTIIPVSFLPILVYLVVSKSSCGS